MAYRIRAVSAGVAAMASGLAGCGAFDSSVTAPEGPDCGFVVSFRGEQYGTYSASVHLEKLRPLGRARVVGCPGLEPQTVRVGRIPGVSPRVAVAMYSILPTAVLLNHSLERVPREVRAL
jgi:hypothetical protein